MTEVHALGEFNLAILLPIILISLALTLFALIDCIRSTSTNGPKWVWILVILFINLLGPVLYFVLGRRNE